MHLFNISYVSKNNLLFCPNVLYNRVLFEMFLVIIKNNCLNENVGFLILYSVMNVCFLFSKHDQHIVGML